MPENITTDFKCYICRRPVAGSDIEKLGANLVYKKVHMCQRCKRIRKTIIFSLIGLLIATIGWSIFNTIN